MTSLGNRSQQIPGAVFRIGGSHSKNAWIWAERSFGSLKCSRRTRSGCSVEILPPVVVFVDVVIISLFFPPPYDGWPVCCSMLLIQLSVSSSCIHTTVDASMGLGSAWETAQGLEGGEACGDWTT